MPAILVASKMKSELPKPVHSALPMPQQAGTKTGTAPAGKLKSALGSQSAHRTLQRNQSLGTGAGTGTGAPVKKSPASKGSTTDPQIYTDWANHYLAKSGHKRLIKDLQQDVADGVLLAEIIQVVANEKIQHINGYPQSRSQMIGNIEACLGFLAAKGVNIKGLCAEEIRNGNLKAILGLFFSLSRYKQQQTQPQKPTAQTQRPHSPAQPPLAHAGQTLPGSPCPIHGPLTPSSPAAKTQADMTSSHSSKDSTQSKRPKLSVAQRKASRLPGPTARSGEGKLRGARGTASRRSQSFNHFDKAKPSFSAAPASPSPTGGRDTERVGVPSPVMADFGPVHSSSPEPSGGVGGGGGTSSGKPWRSKSLNAKHSSTAPMLSVKQAGSSSSIGALEVPSKVKQAASSGVLEVPPKVIAQKSMLEKLKLFNSKGVSKGSSGGAPAGEQQGALDLDTSRPGTPGSVCGSQQGDEAGDGHQRPVSRSADASPKLALRGIAQRTLSRALTPKKSALKKDGEKDKEKEKEKAWSREKDRALESSLGRTTTPDQQHLREPRADSTTSTPELKKSSSLPKGSKGTGSAKKESSSLARGSGIPKPGGKAANAGRGSVAPSGGRDGERGSHAAKASAGLSVHKGQPDSRNSSSSSLASSEGRALHSTSLSSCGPLLANAGATQQSTAGTTASVELPPPQQQHSHPNMATVAPFMYRSQTDINRSDILAETEGFPEPLLLCKSLHTSLEYLPGEDSEARRLRTVKNIADLRQNLEETMFSLRGTQISHSTLETTFDSSVTTEVSGRSGVLAGRPASALSWRQGASSPRLQAGDAPSIGPRPGGNATRFTSTGARYQLHHRQAAIAVAGGNPHLPDMAEEELDTFTMETGGYMSDGDILGKAVSQTDCISTSGYMTDGGLGVYTRRLNRLPETGMTVVRENVHRSGASQADTDSWDDSSSVSSGISDTLDTDELNTSSSVSSFVNTPSAPRKDLGQQLQTDAEKHSVAELSGAWSGDETKHCLDGNSKMDAVSGKWCRHPSDISDEPDKSSSSRKAAVAVSMATMPTNISHTGSWRRGMTAQVGVTAPRPKGTTPAGGGMLKSHSTGKTDDAKVSEKGCFPPRSSGLQPGSEVCRDDTRKPPLSASSSSSRASQTSPGNPTTTFGFKKQTAILSGSATLGKLPKSLGSFQGSRSAGLGRQSSVDDAYLPVSSGGGSIGVSRGSLQYRSLPRPSRSARSAAAGADSGLRTATLPKGRSTTAATKAVGAGHSLTANGGSNQTDREKGSEVDGLKTAGQGQTGSARQAGGKYSEMSSPTLRRLFGGKPSKQASLSSTESMKSSTVISNPHATTGQQGGAGGCGVIDTAWSSTLAYPAAQGNGGTHEATEGTLSREEALAACLHSSGGMVKTGLATRYAHLPQLRGQEEQRDWLRSHSAAGGLQEAAGSAFPFSPSPATSLASPSATTRFNFTQLGASQSAVAHVSMSSVRTTTGPANQDDPYSDPRLRNSSMPLEDKGRAMSTSGSFRDGLEEVHGSSLSLVSSTSSVYSTPEEKSHSEIRKLRRELDASQEKVSALTTQLSANAHLVAAFEQSLGNMTIRLQSLTMTAEQKDSELSDLRKTIELLKNQNTAAQEAINCVINTPDVGYKGLSNSAGGAQQSQPPSHTQPQLQPQTHTQPQAQTQMQTDLRIHRQHSSDSVSSITSATSHSSVGSSLDLDAKNKKRRKNWAVSCVGVKVQGDSDSDYLRSSFKQAFTKKKSPKSASSHSDIEEMTDSSLPSSPKLSHNGATSSAPLLRSSHSNSLPLLTPLPARTRGWGSNSALVRTGSLARISECGDNDAETVMQLRSELRDKEMKLTDIRLEALSSAHQLDQFRESMNRMQGEIEKLKAENDRLKMESQGSFSRATSQSSSLSPSLPALSSQHSLSLSESTSLDMLLEDCGDGGSRKEGRRVKIVVSLEDEAKWKEDGSPRQFLIGSIGVSGKTKWDVLDGVVRRLFKEYIIHVDPVSQLGLNSDSVLGYSIGEVHRTNGAETPELLPCGYLVGESDTIAVKLKGACENSTDSLVFETLIPKAMLQRYMSQLQEHRRIILSGPSGTGKSFLASRLAEHMVLREGRQLTDGAITTFNVDHKSSKELRQYLCQLADQCSGSTGSQAQDLPLVLILDNLHHLSSLGEIFNGLLNSKHHHCPYIIGTMNQASASTPNLQLHQNFRWVLCANHTEPLKGFLGRYLRRKLLETEISSRTRSAELVRVVEWVPSAWHHLNRFLETHSSSDVTIGPRLFLPCPMDVEGARVWFTDLWNYSIIPYMLEAVREGLQMYGRRAAWEDPAKWVTESFPWAASPQQHEWPALLQLRPEDVGFDGYSLAREGGHTKQDTQGETEGDPLINMLMRLKEAAHSTGSQSYDSDSNSNSHQDNVIDSSLESTL